MTVTYHMGNNLTLSKRTVLSEIASIYDPLGLFSPVTSSLQCYSVLSDIWVKIELCIPLEPESSVLSTGNASVCISPLSKLKFAVLFCSIYKEPISFSAILF